LKAREKREGESKVAIAIAAHPDDIEFSMAGTLLRLKETGWSIHYMNLSSGNCGSTLMNGAETRRVRRKEAMAAAGLLGAKYHEALCDDLEIFYDLKTLRRLAAVIRKVSPSIVLTHSPEDYMEDHMNTCRLAVTGAFSRGMPNFRTIPAAKAISGDVAIYHAMPHGLRDGLRRPAKPEFYVDTGSTHARKREALGLHQSQKEWLDASQGMDSYLRAMDDLSRELGRWSGKFEFAEGWRRHSHLGFGAADFDPLRDALKSGMVMNKGYLKSLE